MLENNIRVCPICNGFLISYENGAICDTCTYRVDNEGFEYVDNKLINKEILDD